METKTRNEKNYRGANLDDVACFRDYASEEALRAMIRQQANPILNADSKYEGDWARQVIAKLTDYSREHTQNHPYHNFPHEMDVAAVCAEIARRLNLPAKDRFILAGAGITHDLIVIFGARDNEVKTARKVNDLIITPDYRVSHTDAEEIGRTIVQTEVPQKPYTLLGQIICDADLANLGRTDFFAKGELLAQEWNMPLDRKFYERQLAFIKSHEYHTQVARDMFDEQKAKNIQKLEEMLRGAEC